MLEGCCDEYWSKPYSIHVKVGARCDGAVLADIEAGPGRHQALEVVQGPAPLLLVLKCHCTSLSRDYDPDTSLQHDMPRESIIGLDHLHSLEKGSGALTAQAHAARSTRRADRWATLAYAMVGACFA